MEDPRNLSSPARSTLRIPLTLACLAAFFAMGSTAESWTGPAIFGLLLLAHHVIPWRIPASKGTRRAIRLMAFSWIILVVGWPQESVFQWYLKSSYTILIGQLLMAEIVICAWRSREEKIRLDPHQRIIPLSAFVLACASNTFDRQPMQTVAPIYFTLLAVSLPTLGVRQSTGGMLNRSRALVVAVAMMIGFTTIGVLSQFDRELQVWAMALIRLGDRKSDIGLSTSPQLGSVFNPEPSMERVFRIDGSPSERHMRVLAFDTLSENQWGPGVHQRAFTRIAPADLHPAADGKPISVHLLGDTFDMLPTVLESAGLQADADLEMDGGGALRSSGTTVAGDFKLVLPADESKQGPICRPVDTEQRARLLVLPPSLNPAVAQMAIQAAGNGDVRSKITKLAQNLQSHHAYSLSFEPAAGDPLSDFILNDRAAHCEYFASAMVVLCRAAGIPARMVTGYYAHERSGSSGLVVRDRDAHAWAECWVDGTGWITADATPATGRPDSLFPPPSSWRIAWEDIIDFPTMIRDWLSFISQRTILWVLFLCGAAAVLLATMQWLRRKKIVAEDESYASPDAALVRLAMRLQAWLQRTNLQCPPEQTWRDLAKQLRDRDLFLQFINAYERVRFGGADDPSLAAAERAMNELEQLPTA